MATIHDVHGMATLRLSTDPLGLFADTSDGRIYFAPLPPEAAQGLALGLLAQKEVGGQLLRGVLEAYFEAKAKGEEVDADWLRKLGIKPRLESENK